MRLRQPTAAASASEPARLVEQHPALDALRRLPSPTPAAPLRGAPQTGQRAAAQPDSRRLTYYLSTRRSELRSRQPVFRLPPGIGTGFDGPVQKPTQRLGRLRLAKIVALAEFASKSAELLGLLSGLNAFGRHAQFQGLSKGNDAANDGGVLAVSAEFGHERAVDLDHVDRETIQVRQRRVACPKTIDSQWDPEIRQLAERFDRRLGILHGDALGDLQLEVTRMEAGIPQSTGHYRHQVGLLLARTISSASLLSSSRVPPGDGGLNTQLQPIRETLNFAAGGEVGQYLP